jgi:hypothetical protein
MVKEAQVPDGSEIDTPTPNQPSHLVDGTMLNPQVTASIVIPF